MVTDRLSTVGGIEWLERWYQMFPKADLLAGYMYIEPVNALIYFPSAFYPCPRLRTLAATD